MSLVSDTWSTLCNIVPCDDIGWFFAGSTGAGLLEVVGRDLLYRLYPDSRSACSSVLSLANSLCEGIGYICELPAAL
jgi:hypothetical protein